MNEQDLKAIKEEKITAQDMPISMKKATERLNARMIEWEEHPEHFDDVNPFAIAVFEIRQRTLKWEAQEPVMAVRIKNKKYIGRNGIVFDGSCGNCNGYLLRKWRACPLCGMAVKWDE